MIKSNRKTVIGLDYMIRIDRLQIPNIDGIEDIFTAEFTAYLTNLHDKFSTRIGTIREKRSKVLDKAVKYGILPDHPPTSEINLGNWKILDVPEELKKPGIEISGPASNTSMFINGLNPDIHGIRAEGDLDDDEDSSGHTLIDTITATKNRLAAVNGTLYHFDIKRGKEYKLNTDNLPFFMHRERGIMLDESEVKIDGCAISAALLGTALTMFYAGRAQIERRQGVYFYLPKMEVVEEAYLWRDFFDYTKSHLRFDSGCVIKAIPLIESLPIAYQMEEVLYALGPYSAGLNAARWDLKASILEFVMANPNSIWPDRFAVDIKSTDFLANIFRRLVAVCLKRGAVAIGGMATALPNIDEDLNKMASDSIRTDKEWEAKQGFIRGWVAHIYHMKTASDPFKNTHNSSWKPTPKMQDPKNYPINIEVPIGNITIDGTRQNVRMIIEYLEGWLAGKGAKGINSLGGRPGKHLSMMEDLATGRISVAQIAQRILHKAKDSNTGEIHSFKIVKGLLNEELESILNLLDVNLSSTTNKPALVERYHKSRKIAMHWIKNYTEFNFKSLGAYTRTELDAIAKAPEAF